MKGKGRADTKGDFGPLLAELQSRLKKVALGGGKKKIAAQHAQNKLTARERIAYLLDKQPQLMEVGQLAGEDMYAEYGGCPSGVVVGWVSGRQCVVVAGDATVKAGAWFPITAKKNLRAQEIALQNHLPIIYLVDSAGVFLPLQDEVFPDRDHFGRQFYYNARLSAMGLVQIAAVMGSCVAGGAYLPAMSDEILMVNGSGSMFLGGPYLVQAAIGEKADKEQLGGAHTHCAISGVADTRFPDDTSCLDAIKRSLARLGDATQSAGFDRSKSLPPARNPQDLYQIVSAARNKAYAMKEVIACMVDESKVDWFKAEYGATLLCGYARLEGWAVGIVANERQMVQKAKGERQMGGVIYSDSADKAARFVMNCNQRRIPLIFLHDVSGFMVGTRAEQGGIIKDGAKLVNVVANSVVPKFSIIIGNSFGAGHYAMCSRAYEPRFIYAWPSAAIGVMSGQAAADTLLQVRMARQKEAQVSEKEKALWRKEIQSKYQQSLSPYYAAARLWIDGIIDPIDTRRVLAQGIACANHAPIQSAFQTGILQT